MSDATCIIPGCAQPPAKSRRGMCGKHYREDWKSRHTCSVDGCTRPYLGDGYCGLHYKRARNGLSFDLPPLGAGKAVGCLVEGCTRPYHARGYCGVHLQRLNRTGDPLAVLRETRTDCSIPGCEGVHFGLGYCALHYKRYLRWGDAAPDFLCKKCGAEFDRDSSDSRSYLYCTACHERVPAGYRLKRQAILDQNNASMTEEDWALSNEYVQIIRGDPCVYCGGPSAAIDHIHPVTAGGSSEWDNLAPICKRCNSRKRTRSVLDVMLVRLESSPSERGAHHQAA